DIVDKCSELSFVRRSNTAFDLFGIEPGKLPSHGNHRDVNAGKDVGRGAIGHNGAEDQDQQRHHDKSIRAVKSNSYYPHIRPPEVISKWLAGNANSRCGAC